MESKIKNFNIKGLKNNKFTVFSHALLLIAFIAVIYYMLGPSEGYIHSDSVDTISWAVGSAETGKLFSDTFFYPCLLPFGSTFLVYPFVKVLGFTMLAYRLSMLVFMLLLSASIYFMCRNMGWSKNLSILTIAVELIMVSSSVKLRELFWEHIIYYSLGVFLSFVLLALTFAFIKKFSENSYFFKSCKEAVILIICIALWTFLSAFNGVTTLALSTLPVAAGVIIAVILNTERKIISVENKGIFISFIVMTAATIIGSAVFAIISKDISTGYADAYSVIGDRGEWGNNMLKFFMHWTSLLGADYETGQSVTKLVNVFAAFKLAGSLVLFIVPIYAAFIFKKLSLFEKIFLIYHWAMTAFILYGFIIGSLSGVNWRLSPIVCSAVVINICVFKNMWDNIETQRIAYIAAFFIGLSCVVTLGQIAKMPPDYGRDNNHHKAIELLESNDLTYGYATYWNANLLTLLSSSKVKVRDFHPENGDLYTGHMNCDRLWYEDQPGVDRYFILLSHGEYQDMMDNNHFLLNEYSDKIENDNWIVLIMDHNIF